MTMFHATTALLAAAALPASLFPIVYQWTTRGTWRKSEMGRHVMSLMAVLALLLDFSVGIRIFGRPGWIGVVAVILYSCVVLLMWQRLFLLVKAQRHDGQH